jgi:hypothetical protein
MIMYGREVFRSIGFLVAYFALTYALSGFAFGRHLEPPADVLIHVLAGPIAFLLSAKSGFTSGGSPFLIAFTIVTAFTFAVFWYLFVKHHDRYTLLRGVGFVLLWLGIGFVGFIVSSYG